MTYPDFEVGMRMSLSGSDSETSTCVALQDENLRSRDGDVLLTVGIPVRNGEATIRDTLLTVLASSFHQLRVVVADNNSTDSTIEIVRQFCLEDERVVLRQHSEDLGAVRNFQFLLSEANTPYFAWVAADDLVEHTYFADCISTLELHEGSTLSFGNAKIQYRNGGSTLATYRGTSDFLASRVVRVWRVLTRFRSVNLYGVYRTDAAKAAGPLVEILASDALFIRRLALLGGFAGHTQSAYVYRISPEWRTSVDYYADSPSESNLERRGRSHALDLVAYSLRDLGGGQNGALLKWLLPLLVLLSEARRLSRLLPGVAIGKCKKVRSSHKRALLVYRLVHGLQDVEIGNPNEFMRRIVIPSLRWSQYES